MDGRDGYLTVQTENSQAEAKAASSASSAHSILGAATQAKGVQGCASIYSQEGASSANQSKRNDELSIRDDSGEIVPKSRKK